MSSHPAYGVNLKISWFQFHIKVTCLNKTPKKPNQGHSGKQSDNTGKSKYLEIPSSTKIYVNVPHSCMLVENPCHRVNSKYKLLPNVFYTVYKGVKISSKM